MNEKYIEMYYYNNIEPFDAIKIQLDLMKSPNLHIFLRRNTRKYLISNKNMRHLKTIFETWA